MFQWRVKCCSSSVFATDAPSCLSAATQCLIWNDRVFVHLGVSVGMNKEQCENKLCVCVYVCPECVPVGQWAIDALQTHRTSQGSCLNIHIVRHRVSVCQCVWVSLFHCLCYSKNAPLFLRSLCCTQPKLSRMHTHSHAAVVKETGQVITF